MIMKNSNSQQNPNLDSEQQESKPTLLLVDDEESILASLKRLLRRKYKILSTTDGIEALSILQENANNIDVIIVDQRMPKMNGIDFLKQVKDDYNIVLTVAPMSGLVSLVDQMEENSIKNYVFWGETISNNSR